jgi:methyltransferase
VSLIPHWLVALVALQRLLELVLSRRNTARLLAAGAQEIGASHYPLIVALHVGWLAALWASVPASAAISWPWLAVYVALECGRIWTMLTLGRYWTTRIIHVPDAPLVRSGPYRFCRHPNYAIVCGEIAVLPLVLGQWQIALVFSTLNAALLAWRIRVENTALAMRSGRGAGQ